MGCAQSTKQSKNSSKQKQNKKSEHQQSKSENITEEFMYKAKEQGISVNKSAHIQNDPSCSDLPTRDYKSKTQSFPVLQQNYEILQKHAHPKLKPLSSNSLFKNRQSLGLNVHDQRSTIASLCPHRCSPYFLDQEYKNIPNFQFQHPQMQTNV